MHWGSRTPSSARRQHRNAAMVLRGDSPGVFRARAGAHGSPRNLGGPMVSAVEKPEGPPAKKGPGPQASGVRPPVGANGGTPPRYRRAKATKQGGRGNGESERSHSTREAGEPTPGTPRREGERRATGLLEGTTTGTPISGTVSTRLQRIAELAREAPKRAFLSLAHHIDVEFLREAFRRTRKDGATGVDGRTGAEYEERLEENLRSLLDCFKSGRYKAPPVRRTYVPKGDGSRRPIGIPTFEDKVLQRAVTMVMEAVYEQDFLPCSHGYRPGRSAHIALAELRARLMAMGGGWVLEVDIKSFFDSLDHARLRNILDQRVRDGVLRRTIDKWLAAGVLEGTEWSRPDAGTPQGGVITPRTQKVTSVVSEVIGATRRREAASVGRSRWHGDAVADHDRVIADEHLLDDQSHEALPLENVERIGGYAQPNEKCRECLRQAQVGCSLTSLLGDRLQLDAQRLLALAQWRHPLSQVLQRQKILLIGSEHPLDALAHSEQIPLHRLFALLRGIGGTSRVEPTIEFLLNKGRIFEQPNDLGPDDLIQQILPHGSVVTAGTAEVSPPIRADAAIVMDQARSGPGRRAREGIAAPAAAHQTLHDARLDRPSPCPDLVLVQQFLRTRKGRLSDERRYRNLDPLFTRPLVVGAVATRHAAPQSQRPRHTLARGHTGLAEAGRAAIGRVPQHRPHHGALPPGARLTRGHAMIIEPAGNRPDAPALHRVGLIDMPHHARLGLDHGIGGRTLLTLTDIAIAVRGAAQHADFARASPVTLPAARALEDLGPFVLGDHPLKLHKQLILRAYARRRVQKMCLHALTGQLFDQEDLVGVLATQAIRGIDEHGLDLSFGRQVAHPFQAWSLERRPAIALVFEDPGLRHLEIERPRQLDQRRGLARNRVCFALLLRGDPCVNRRHPHADAPLPQPRAGGLGPGPKSHTRGRVCWPVADRTHSRAEPAAWRDRNAAQPRRRRKAPRNAASACVTICPSVSPLRRAYACRPRTILTGTLKVTTTVGSTVGTGALNAAACSR